MGLTNINQQQDAPKGPSALENAAKVLGILQTVGSAGNAVSNGYDTFVNKPAQTALEQQKVNLMSNGSKYVQPSLGALTKPGTSLF